MMLEFRIGISPPSRLNTASSTTELLQERVRPPILAQLPAGTPPKGAFLFSALVHTAAIFSVLTWLPILFPGRTISSGLTVADIIRDFDVQPLTLPPLKEMRNAPSRGGQKANSGAILLHPIKAETYAGSSTSNPPIPDFVNHQLLVSNFPDATNTVQTIRRPDMVAPPKLPYPTRLPSLVMLPPPSAPRKELPQPEQPELPSPREQAAFLASEPRVRVPALPMGAPKGSLAAPKLVEQPVLPNLQTPSSPFRPDRLPLQVPALPMGTPRGLLTAPKLVEQPILPNSQSPSSPFQTSEPRVQAPAMPMSHPIRSQGASGEQVAPEIIGISDRTVPVFSGTTTPVPSDPKAIIVVNALSVPPGPIPAIPNAELTGNFVVGPSKDATASGTASSPTDKYMAGANPTNAAKYPALNEKRSEMGTVSIANGESAGATRIGALAGAGSLSISGGSRGEAGGNRNLPGITISGGISGRGGQALTTSSLSNGSYAITIISSGNNGGASRDLGVFSRSDTVYTVSIPMTDAGGGPDCPIEYALVSPASTGNGLLIPPVVLKKIRAIRSKTDVSADSGPVFVAGIIDESGKLKGLRAIKTQNDRARSAVDALEQWEFLPAQLEGKPVATKVLIGVTVLPAPPIGNQN